MNTLIKVLLGIAAALVLLVALAMVAVVVLVDPNDYRDRLSAMVEQQTGRSLSIEGDLSLKLFPCCAIGVGKTILSNPAGFGDAPFVSVDEARVGLKLLPLLMERKLVVGKLKFSGLQLDLLRRADGAVNWEFSSTQSEEPQKTPPPADTGPGLNDLSVAGISITDASIHYRDQRAGTDYRIQNVELETGPIDEARPFDVQGSLDLSDQTGLSARLDLKSRMALDPGQQVVELESLNVGLTMPELELTADASGRLAASQTALSGHFDLAPLSLRKLARSLDADLPETADPKALSRLQASGDWRLGADSIQLSALELELDDTRITGEAGVKNFGDPAITFEFSADRIDLDRYLAPAGDSDRSTGAPARPDSGADSSFDVVKALNLEGQLGLDDLRVSGAKLQSLQAAVHAHDGIVRLDPVSARLYGGSYAGVVKLDLRGKQPRIDVDQSLDAVQVGGLLADVAEIEQLDGTVVANIDASGTGLTKGELLKSMKGQLSFKLSDGIYKGMDIWQEIRKARALIKGKAVPPAEGPPQTRITDLQMDGRLSDGMMYSDRLIAEIPFLQLTGTGSVDLLKQWLDYRLQARVFDRPEFPDGENLDDLTGLVIPLTVAGDVESPKIGVDLAGLAKSAAGKKLQQKLFDKLGLGDSEDGDSADQNQGQDQDKKSSDAPLERELKKLLPF